MCICLAGIHWYAHKQILKGKIYILQWTWKIREYEPKERKTHDNDATSLIIDRPTNDLDISHVNILF